MHELLRLVRPKKTGGTYLFFSQGEGKVHPRTGHKGPEGKEGYSSTLSLTSSIQDVDAFIIIATPLELYPRKDPLPTVREAGWVPGSVWTDAENLAPTGIQSPEHPVCSESLYEIRYTGSIIVTRLIEIAPVQRNITGTV